MMNGGHVTAHLRKHMRFNSFSGLYFLALTSCDKVISGMSPANNAIVVITEASPDVLFLSKGRTLIGRTTGTKADG